MAIRKSSYNFRISEDGKWTGLNSGIWDEISKKFAGHNVTLTVSPRKKDKTLPQLGYFYAVFIPHYMYALIDAGHDFEIGNSVDEKIVEDELKRKYLDNGTEWITPLEREIISPKDGFVVYREGGYYDAGLQCIRVMDSPKEVGEVIVSPIAGTVEKRLDNWVEVKKGEVLAIIHGQHVIKSKASLASAGTKEVNKMIKDAARDCAIYFNYSIPEPDPLADSSSSEVKAMLIEKLRSKGR